MNYVHVSICAYVVGMKVLYRKFPRGMLSGAVPKSCLPSPPPTARKGSGKQSTTPKPTQEEVVVRHRSHFTSEGMQAPQCVCVCVRACVCVCARARVCVRVCAYVLYVLYML